MVIEALLKNWIPPKLSHFSPVYLVGGAVRDHLLNRPIKDVDIVCRDAAGLAETLGKSKTVAVVPFMKKAEEPCFRIVNRYNPQNFMDLSGMIGQTIEKDLRRRDFSINAMAMEITGDGSLGALIDPLGGAADLNSRVVRLAGPGALRSDPLRILRAVRIAAELDFDIEAQTLQGMETHAGLVAKSAAERIMAELLRIMDVPRSYPFIDLLDRIGGLEVIFPEITPMKGCSQNSYHHKDVWRHSLIVYQNCEEILSRLDYFFGNTHLDVHDNLAPGNRQALLKLAALLHDIGKPATREVNAETGRITFYGHDRKGGEIIHAMAVRLKFSNRQREFLKLLISEHLHVLNLSHPVVGSPTRLRWFRDLREDAIPAIVLSMADIKGTLGTDSSEQQRSRHLAWSSKAVADYYGKVKRDLERPNLIGGKDLRLLGVPEGPMMGCILKRIREAQDQDLISNRKQALDLARKLASEELQHPDSAR